MENQKQESNEKKTLGLYSLFALPVITSLVVGLGVYFFLDSQCSKSIEDYKSKNNSLQSQVKNLENEISELKGEATPSAKTEESIYSNSELGISFEYDDEKINIKEEESSVFVKDNDGYGYIFKITSAAEDSLDEYWQNRQAKIESGELLNYSKEETTYKNYPALYLKHQEVMQIPMDQYVVKTDNGLLVISFEVMAELGIDYEDESEKSTYKASWEKDKEIVEGILSSLKIN